MRINHFFTAFAAIVALSVVSVSVPAIAAQKYACDRECMVDFMKQYLQALAKHDPIKSRMVKPKHAFHTRVPLISLPSIFLK